MPKALLIDDEAALTTIVARFLEGAGFEVETATSGREGIRKALASQPDVVVLDVMMPEMDGYEVCRRLRRDPRTVRTAIVVLTARGQDIDKEIAFRAGADAHLAKPYQGKVLTEEIRQLLASRPEVRPPLGHQVLVLRLQPDAGATTLVTNLAYSLMNGQRLVAAVDLEFGSGQLENHLGLPPTRTWPQNVGSDPSQLAQCLVRHQSGLFALPAPPPGTEPPQTSEVKEILQLLRSWHDFIVLDTPFNLGPLAPVLFTCSPVILLLLSPDAAVFKTAQASIAAIRKMGLRSLHLWPIVNRARPGQEGFRQQVEATLGMPVVASLPWAPEECAEALANGRPTVLGNPQSPLAAAFRGLAQQIVHALSDQPLRRIPR